MVEKINLWRVRLPQFLGCVLPVVSAKKMFLTSPYSRMLYNFLWAFEQYIFRAGPCRRTNLCNKSSQPVRTSIDRAVRLNRLLTAKRYAPGTYRLTHSGNRHPSNECSASPARIRAGLEKLIPQNLPEVAMPLIVSWNVAQRCTSAFH